MKKKSFFVETLDQFRPLEVPEKARNVFVMSLRLSDHKRYYTTTHLHQVFSFSLGFSLFFSLVFRTSKFLPFKEFNKTIIPFALVGYETGYSQLRTTRARWLFTISYPTRAHGSFRPFATNDHMVQNPPCWRASSLLFPHWDIKTKASQA